MEFNSLNTALFNLTKDHKTANPTLFQIRLNEMCHNPIIRRPTIFLLKNFVPHCILKSEQNILNNI